MVRVRVRVRVSVSVRARVRTWVSRMVSEIKQRSP